MATDPALAGPSLLPTPLESDVSHSSQGSTASPGTGRRKSTTKPAPPRPVKRATSSPNVRTVSSEEGLNAFAAEKRRNKLGYHRTSVACGHCRRRKIRCLIAPEDPHGKCQNCLRLKKDCNFFPVDQNPVPERRPRSGSKADLSSNEAETSHSSSPGFAAGFILDSSDLSQPRLPPLPLLENRAQVQEWALHGGVMGSPFGMGPSSAQSSEFPRMHDQSGQIGASPYLHHSPQSMATDRSQTDDLPYWRPHENTMSNSYPQSYIPLPTQRSADELPTLNSQEGPQWHLPQQPIRSTSFNSPGEIPPQYQAQYYQNATADFERRMTMPSGLSGQTQPSMHSTMPQDHASVAVPYESMTNIMPYDAPGPWSSAPPQMIGQMTRNAQEGYSEAWYNNPASLPLVREEDSVLQQQAYQQSMHHPYHPG